VLAAKLLDRMRAELLAIADLGEWDQVLVSTRLTGLRAARPPRYAERGGLARLTV